MASNDNTSTTSEASAAAEEPGLNGDGHDDERVHVPTKGKGTGKGKLKAGAKKGKGAAGPLCATCGEPASQRCTGCGVVHYCRKNMIIKNGKQVNGCQQVPRARAHAHTLRVHIEAKLS